MWQESRQFNFLFLFFVCLSVGEYSSQVALAQTELRANPVWELKLPKELQARLYDVAVVPGTTQLVATTPHEILRIGEQGTVRSLLSLQSTAVGGESAILSADGSHAGIMIHRGHAISGFRFVELNGNVLASIEAPHQFHYRIAPDHSTFVGIDAGGHHSQAKAKQFIYRIYDRSGRLSTEIESTGPQAIDSAYTTDGAALILNNSSGLSAYRVLDGEQLWRTDIPTRLFAPASAASQIVLASSANDRKMLQAFRGGDPLWRYRLNRNVRNLSISPNGEFMLASDGNTAHLFSPGNSAPLWSREMPNKSLVINSLAVNDKGIVALGAQHSDLTNGLALVIDRAGNTLYERKLNHGLSNAWIPTVQFDRSGTTLSVRTLEELILIAIE